VIEHADVCMDNRTVNLSLAQFGPRLDGEQLPLTHSGLVLTKLDGRDMKSLVELELKLPKSWSRSDQRVGDGEDGESDFRWMRQ